MSTMTNMKRLFVLFALSCCASVAQPVFAQYVVSLQKFSSVVSVGDGTSFDDATLKMTSYSSKRLPPYTGSSVVYDNDNISGNTKTQWIWSGPASSTPAKAKWTVTDTLSLATLFGPFGLGGVEASVGQLTGRLYITDSLGPVSLTSEYTLQASVGGVLGGIEFLSAMSVKTGVECCNVGRPASASTTGTVSMTLTPPVAVP